VLAAAALEVLLAPPTAPAPGDPYSPWNRRDGWRLQGSGTRVLALRDGTETHRLRLAYVAGGWRLEAAGASASLAGHRLEDGMLHLVLDGVAHRVPVLRDGDAVQVSLDGAGWTLVLGDPYAPPGGDAVVEGRLAAPIPGRVVQLLVRQGETVSRGQVLAVLEAMKTELRITAPADGVVAHLGCAVGDSVEEGTEIVTLEASAAG
jgi:3-methylcrotonyl-CoA carboxylase alpha subunit